MKIVGNIIKGILITIWVIVAIIATVCLISTNDFGVTEIGSKTVFVIDDDSHKPDFYKNDLIIASKTEEDNYEVGDSVFYYLDNARDGSFIKNAKITSIDKNEGAEDAYHFARGSISEDANNDIIVSYSRMIGKANESKVIHKLGLLLNILENRFGFLFLIILPTIFAIVFEVYTIIEEVKSND